MFTTCPKCSLKLVVTAADLRVAQGYVRCGRCANVFNALAGLSDEQQAVLAREQAAAARETPPPAPESAPAGGPAPPHGPTARPAPQPPSTSPSPAREPLPGTPSAERSADRALEFDASATDVSEVFVEPADDDPTGTFESIVLRSEDVPEAELTAPQGAPHPSTDGSETHELEIDLEELVSAAGTSAAAETPRPPPMQRNGAPRDAAAAPRSAEALDGGAPRDAPPRVAREMREEAPAVSPARMHEPARLGTGDGDHGAEAHAGRAQRLTERGLRVGSAALALLLVLQIVHHERAELAGVGWLRAPLTAAYSALGMPLTPHWDVHAYEVRQLGAFAGPRNAGTLTVRASVKNDATRDQPLPLLRVTMQDRFGNRIAARDVPPSAYLPAGSVNGTDLAAGQRVDAEIAFVDPGPNAVGFEIDACLKLARGRIACANDVRPP